jgi:hypothetical protein
VAGAISSPLTDNENRRSILGYKQRCMPAWLHKAALRDDPQRAAEMCAKQSSAKSREPCGSTPIVLFSAMRILKDVRLRVLHGIGRADVQFEFAKIM